MIKKLLVPAFVLGLAAAGLGGPANAHDEGPNCGTSGPLGESGIGIHTGPGTCYDEFQDGHGHCEYFVVALGLFCE